MRSWGKASSRRATPASRGSVIRMSTRKPSPKIVLVEDDRILQKVMDRLLKRCGFRVTVASNANAALLHVRAEAPDLVLMDVNIPGANGYQVMQRLKTERHTRDIPVIFLTGSDSPQSRERASRHGAFEFLEKPCEPRMLLATIHRALGRGTTAASII